MTSPIPSLPTRRARLARLAVACAVLGAGTDAVALSLPQRAIGAAKGFGTAGQFTSAKRTVYLAALGPGGFRFAPPPPEPEERPVPVAPAVEPVVAEPTPEPEPVVTTPPPTETRPADEAPPAAEEKPVAILPDDTPRDVRAEDILPFFQLPKDPAGGASASVVVPFTPATPQGATLPPSSATYQQK